MCISVSRLQKLVLTSLLQTKTSCKKLNCMTTVNAFKILTNELFCTEIDGNEEYFDYKSENKTSIENYETKNFTIGIVYLILGTISLLMNSITLNLLRKHEPCKLRFFFAASISISCLLLVVTMFASASNRINGEWSLGFRACQVSAKNNVL